MGTRSAGNELPLLSTRDAYGHAWAALGAGLPGADAEKGHDCFELLPILVTRSVSIRA